MRDVHHGWDIPPAVTVLGWDTRTRKNAEELFGCFRRLGSRRLSKEMVPHNEAPSIEPENIRVPGEMQGKRQYHGTIKISFLSARQPTRVLLARGYARAVRAEA